MYLIMIAWFYVTLMMAIAEATNPIGSILGGVVTFVLYGLLPMGILWYILSTPTRKRRLQVKRQQEELAWQAKQAATHADVAGHAEPASDTDSAQNDIDTPTQQVPVMASDSPNAMDDTPPISVAVHSADRSKQ